MVEDASKDAEAHWVHVAKVVEATKTASKVDADAAVIAAREQVLASLVPGFEQHMAELKKDSMT